MLIVICLLLVREDKALLQILQESFLILAKTVVEPFMLSISYHHTCVVLETGANLSHKQIVGVLPTQYETHTLVHLANILHMLMLTKMAFITNLTIFHQMLICIA